MTTPITHNAARQRVGRYFAGAGEGCRVLLAYIAQAELVEKERDQLKAKLDFLVICDECKKPIEATDACRCFDGPWRTAERVPGTFHQRCCEPARVKFATARDNARLAAVVREHESIIRTALVSF